MDVRARIGQNLKRHRLARGLSQEEYAHLCQIDQSYVSGIERGRRNPTATVLERLIQPLGISVAALFEPLSGDGREPLP